MDDVLERVAEEQRRAALRRALALLPQGGFEVVAICYGLSGEPQSLDDIGKQLGLTVDQVRLLELGALRRLSAARDGEDLSRGDCGGEQTDGSGAR